jgi:hypothetical protein
VAREISHLGRVPSHISQQVLQEFQQMTVARDFMTEGGRETAHRLLVKALGESGAKAMLHQLTRVDELDAGRAESLQKVDPKHLARLLEGEHPQTVALVLGHLDPRQASAVLTHLPRSTRAESVRRLANLRQFSPAIAERISTAVQRRLRSFGEINRRNYYRGTLHQASSGRADLRCGRVGGGDPLRDDDRDHDRRLRPCSAYGFFECADSRQSDGGDQTRASAGHVRTSAAGPAARLHDAAVHRAF